MKGDGYMRKLLECRPARAVTVATANKTVRFAWAPLTRGEVFCLRAIA